MDWVKRYHGAGLASVGHAVGLPQVLISSAHPVNHLLFCASHPLLDPLWSSERTRIVHFGDVSRAEKTMALAKIPIALANLRVCVANKGGDYNCGNCPKCVRTMIALDAVDALRQAPFPVNGRPLNLPVNDERDMPFAEELEDLLQRLGNPKPALLSMVQRNLNRARKRYALREWVRANPNIRAAIRKVRRVHIAEAAPQPLEPIPPVAVMGK